MSLSEALNPRAIDDRDEYKEADHFKRTIVPMEDTDYGWACQHAQETYDRLAVVYSRLDDKANEIIKYLGGGAGLFTLGLLLDLKPSSVAVIVAAIPSLLLALGAIALATSAREPRLTSAPPDPKMAFEYANSYGRTDHAQGAFIGRWHLACVGMEQAISIKSAKVRGAAWLFFGSIAGLMLPLLVAIKQAWG